MTPNQQLRHRSVCFRVTRYCNARCGFCLAPSDGSHPSSQILTQRIDWLLDRGVHAIHFCGGEPTIHPALPRLLEYVSERGGNAKLTTNGIEMPDALLQALRESETEVKVSLHGNREQHNAMTGCDAFDRATTTLQRLVAARVPASVQTTVVKNAEWVVDWLASYCLKSGIRRLSVLPFIPRGEGLARRAEYELADADRRRLKEHVAMKRRVFGGRLDIRWLDFNAQTVPTVEADGRVILEGLTESTDQLLCRIP